MSDEVRPTLEDLTECWCGYKAPHAEEGGRMMEQLQIGERTYDLRSSDCPRCDGSGLEFAAKENQGSSYSSLDDLDLRYAPGMRFMRQRKRSNYAT